MCTRDERGTVVWLAFLKTINLDITLCVCNNKKIILLPYLNRKIKQEIFDPIFRDFRERKAS